MSNDVENKKKMFESIVKSIRTGMNGLDFIDVFDPFDPLCEIEIFEEDFAIEFKWTNGKYYALFFKELI